MSCPSPFPSQLLGSGSSFLYCDALSLSLSVSQQLTSDNGSTLPEPRVQPPGSEPRVHAQGCMVCQGRARVGPGLWCSTRTHFLPVDPLKNLGEGQLLCPVSSPSSQPAADYK